MTEEIVDAYAPRRILPRIKAAPKIRQIYWCDFGSSPILPEMGKIRPALIISFRNSLSGHCLVLPVSSGKQEKASEPWAHQLWNGVEADKHSFVICNHLYTVATARLQPFDAARIPRLGEAEFKDILEKMYRLLPRLA